MSDNQHTVLSPVCSLSRLSIAAAMFAAVTLGVLSLWVGVAGATVARTQVFASASFSKAQSFGNPTGVAVDQETGNVYVADSQNDVVDIFGAEGGAPTAGVPTQITGLSFGSGEPEQVAVDNSCFYQHLTGSACESYDPSNSDVYVAQSTGSTGHDVAKFHLNAISGQYEMVGTLVPPGGSVEPNGVAVNDEGDVYVANFHSTAISEFNPAGSEIGEIKQAMAPNPAFIAVGASSVLYIGTYFGGAVKVEVNGSDQVQSETVLPGGDNDFALAIDSGADVYLDRKSSIAAYNDSVGLIEEFGSGFFEGSQGLAINDTSNDVYVANGSSKDLVVFGPPVTLPPAPGATTEAASPVSGTTATLHGTVKPEAAGVEYWFEYGKSESYGSETTHEPIPGSSEIAVHTAVEHLEPNTTYHYRLVARNGFGEETKGSDETLMTSGAPPAVISESVESITAHGATLRATINPENAETTYRFEYATNETFTGASTIGEATLAAAFEEDGTGSVTISSGLNPNTTYYYRVVASNGSTNGNGITDGPTQSFVTAPQPPTVSTGEASSITDTTAVLVGVVNGMGTETHYFVNYGLTESYGSSMPASVPSGAISAGVLSTDTAETVELAGLQPNTTYHYQVVAFNVETCFRSFGIICTPPENIVYGQDGEFTTLPLAPGATTDPPVTIGATTATLAGRVVPQGVSVQYHFEYGTTTAYGSSAPAPEGTVSGSNEAEDVTFGLTGLQPGVTYHYRLVATNTGGETPGEDRTFTTNASGEPSNGQLPGGFSLTQTGSPPTGPAATVFADLTPLTPMPPPPTAITTITKTLTNAQKLKDALKACDKDKNKTKREDCEKSAKKQYGPKAKGKGKGKKK